MGKDSRIEWTHHTFNPWWGCFNVSPACDHCYAESWAKRVGSDVWGAEAPRRFFSDAHWREPLKWNAEALKDGNRRRVFCASMADVFEARDDLISSRMRLFDLIEATPSLDWLLLTKRIHMVKKLLDGRALPFNVWLGTTVENQEYAAKRIPYLLEHQDASVRFLSCEPLLGSVDLSAYLNPQGKRGVDWVIAGGESGPGARPMNPDWALALQVQCKAAKVPFHFKQWGHWAPQGALDASPSRSVKTVELVEGTRKVELFAVGKSAAGRSLKGKTWDQFPKTVIHSQ